MTGKSRNINELELIDVAEDIKNIDNVNETSIILLNEDSTVGPQIISVNGNILLSDHSQDGVSICDPTDNVLMRERVSPNFIGSAAKRIRLEKDDSEKSSSAKDILIEFFNMVMIHTKSIDEKMDKLTAHCHQLEEKIVAMSALLEEAGIGPSIESSSSKPEPMIVGMPQGCDSSSNSPTKISSSHMGSNVTLITLNSEEDFPDGSWLGEESNPEMRVRTQISKSELANVNRTCHTPEKMALTLLDYLFDRETQAVSNISGLGKHGKKQLDPLMMYGIRCHLISKFGITEKDWHRIKQNVDSKCRTAFRRKQKGMPLTVKAFRDRWLSQDPAAKIPAAYIQMITGADQNGSLGELVDAELTAEQSLDLSASGINIPIAFSGMQPVSITMEEMPDPQLVQMPEGEIQVLHATAEQLAQFHQAGQIQILAGDLIQATNEMEQSP